MFQWLNVCFKDKDLIADLRRSLRESEKRNEGINREFQKLLRQKEVRIDKCLHLALLPAESKILVLQQYLCQIDTLQTDIVTVFSFLKSPCLNNSVVYI